MTLLNQSVNEIRANLVTSELLYYNKTNSSLLKLARKWMEWEIFIQSFSKNLELEVQT